MESARKTSVKSNAHPFQLLQCGILRLVGISTTHVKNDFNLSEALAGFIPSMAFLWFRCLPVPVTHW